LLIGRFAAFAIPAREPEGNAMFYHPPTIALVIGALTTTVAAHAQERCTPIQFARGATSATVKGMAPSWHPPDAPFACYTFVAGRGQTATVKLTQANQDTAFNIGGLIDSRTDYSFPTEAKTYRIDVYQMNRDRRDVPFAMEVSVK
jgi:hypothetical protein